MRDKAHAQAAIVVLACVLLWTLVPVLLLSAPHGDNVEQLNWSHSLEWGYFKHPPLPTWLLCACIELVGRSAALTYALAMSCVGAALWILWRCARLLLDRETALVALLLSSANYYLMGRGSFLNHNTVMLPFVALSAWAVLRIVQGASWRCWLLLGLAQALGLLTKYQMCLVILANGLALLSAGVHRRPGFARHAALASVATLLPLIPHALWLGSHQFSTFQYAGHSLMAQLGAGPRAAAGARFLGQQVGRLAPAALACALALGLEALRRRRKDPGAVDQPAAPPRSDARQARAMALLALTPLATIMLLCLCLGVAPQNHWGASSTLLIPLMLCHALRRAAPWPLGATAVATATVHLGAVIWNVFVWAYNPGPHHAFAARPLAALAQAYWTAHHSSPLKVLLGAGWEAGSISLYLPGHPAVVPGADRAQAPWVDPQQARGCGALVIGRMGTDLAQQVPAIEPGNLIDREVLSLRDSRGRESSIQVASVAPITPSACN